MKSTFCSQCGNSLKSHNQARFCPNCGQAIENVSANSTIHETVNNTTNIHVHVGRGPYNKWIAFLLAFFLGYLGAHKFYEGKLFVGILYLFTFGLFGIGIIFDLIALLLKPTEYYL